jgi:hypothetical protein
MAKLIIRLFSGTPLRNPMKAELMKILNILIVTDTKPIAG